APDLRTQYAAVEKENRDLRESQKSLQAEVDRLKATPPASSPLADGELGDQFTGKVFRELVAIPERACVTVRLQEGGLKPDPDAIKAKVEMQLRAAGFSIVSEQQARN